MPTRRLLLAALLPALCAPPAWAQDPALAQAVAFIRASGKKLAALSTPATPPAERQARLVALLDQVVDFDSIGQFCLGRFWRLATPAQRGAYLAAFRAVVMRNVTSRMGTYSQGTARIDIGQPTRQGDAVGVPTTVTRPGTAPLRLVWVVGTAGGTPRLVDLVAEGVSLRLTQRSDYTSFIDRNNGSIDALVAAMQRQQATPDPVR